MNTAIRSTHGDRGGTGGGDGTTIAAVGGPSSVATSVPLRLLASAAMVGLACPPPILAQGLASLADAPAEVRELARDNARGFLNDLSARRRTTTMFPNPQSVFAGVQESFVNTSTGALTFLVRDLVRVGGMPIVMGRVYDSTLTDGADFGPGWKPTVVEELRRDGSRLLYTDASNAVHELEISGDAVVPLSPATAPVAAGSIRTSGGGVGIVVLESSDGMLRRFKQDGEVWRLVHVRHGRGWVRLGWRRGALAEVTSDRGRMHIARRDDGRIVSITDDLDRIVGYAYDADGRLTGVTDVAGGSWRIGHVAGGLSSVTDPRGKVVFAAQWTDGRVHRIRALHETTDFRYAGAATTATNLLGWSTVYRHTDSGITESITDRTGATTGVAFDAGHRPVTVTRDGVTLARIGYDAEGRLASLWRPEGETAFTNSRRGVTMATGAWTARYRYADRRIVYAKDHRGERTYRYAEDGSLAGATIDGIDAALRTGTDGTVAEVSRDGRTLAAYAYTGAGRVSSIDYGGGRTAAFEYDARGLRTAADYVYGTDARVAVAMAYDAAGNLTSLRRGLEGGETIEETYRIGDYNEVLWVRTGDGTDPARPDLTFGYDAVGRVERVDAGTRTASVEYDALDRATRLVVDGDTVLGADYGPDDIDVVEDDDRRTSGVPVAAPASPVFGTMESIVYSRPRPAEFGVVVYSPSRKTFELRLDALAPDAVLLASLRARMVPLDGDDPNTAPLGHDKPSNALFVPPEFRSVNCLVCTAVVFQVWLTVTPAPVHCATHYRAIVDGICQFTPPPSDHSPIVFPIHLPWQHTTHFGDGLLSLRTELAYGDVVEGSHVYRAARTYTMTHFVSCLCGSPFGFGRASETFAVPPVTICREPTVEILAADVVSDRVVVRLEPIGVTGTLEVTLVGDTTHVITTRTATGGTYPLSFGISSVPVGTYTDVRATWTMPGYTAGHTRTHRFQVLGNYRHSQYNTPSESMCSGEPRSSYVTNSQCVFTRTSMKSDFVRMVNLNGSGTSLHHGTVGREFWCLSRPHVPDDADKLSFRLDRGTLGACGEDTGNNTVAVDELHQELSCGDRVYIVGVGVKTVTDYCPGCAPNQLDNYTTSRACSDVLDLGDFRTIRL